MRIEIFQDNIETIDNTTIVGYQWIKSKHKGTIVQFADRSFIGIGIDLSAVGKWAKTTKQEYCQHALSKNGEGGARLFKFDTIQELYMWLGNPN